MSAVFEKAVLKARDAFQRNVTKDVKFRIKQLQQLRKCLIDHQDEFVSALRADFKKPRFETIITEIDFTIKDINFHLSYIHEHIKPKYVSKKGIANILDGCFVKPDPYGVVLIISAWNYPIQLLLCPLVGAIAAGNCAIIKPSEISPNTEKLMAKLLPKYLDRECYHVVLGGPEESSRILNERFDKIFFTGSTNIGKIVYNAAAKHLTPVVLELGGKSPVYLDDSVPNLEIAVKRILWAKYLNAGQTCIAPDYLICSAQVQEKFVKVAEKVLKNFYGKDVKNSESFCRIVNDKNFDRLNNLIKSTNGKIVIGGETDRDTRYISPTIITNVNSSDPIMKDEIFGPIFPIVIIDSLDEAIEFIKRGEKPLTMYIYTNKSQVKKRLLNETSSGSVAINECLLQMTVEELPFGGVGYSGIGNYHGYKSFEAFSHQKSVLEKDFNPLIEFFAKARYPPYTDGKLKMMKLLVARSPLDDIDFKKTFTYLFTFLLGVAVTILVYTLKN